MLLQDLPAVLLQSQVPWQLFPSERQPRNRADQCNLRVSPRNPATVRQHHSLGGVQCGFRVDAIDGDGRRPNSLYVLREHLWRIVISLCCQVCTVVCRLTCVIVSSFDKSNAHFLTPLTTHWKWICSGRLSKHTLASSLSVFVFRSDPDTSANGWRRSCRGCSFVFGNDVIRESVVRLDVDLVVRAHQVVQDGYEMTDSRLVLTLFSAPNYCGQVG